MQYESSSIVKSELRFLLASGGFGGSGSFNSIKPISAWTTDPEFNCIHVNETEVSAMLAVLEIKKVTVAEVMAKPIMETVPLQPSLLSLMIVKTSTCVSSKVFY